MFFSNDNLFKIKDSLFFSLVEPLQNMHIFIIRAPIQIFIRVVRLKVITDFAKSSFCGKCFKVEMAKTSYVFCFVLFYVTNILKWKVMSSTKKSLFY